MTDTTRRTILTGLAALPITAATGSAAEAATIPAVAVTEHAPPQFLHEIDRQLARDLDALEQLLATMKDRLAVANHPHPMIRSGALFDMRCSLNAFRITAGFVQEEAEQQRIEAEAAARAFKAAHDLEP